MRAKTIHKQEQYKLIMECRTSGLTDYQWCQEKGIDQNACITKFTNISDEATIEILTSCASIRFLNNV